MIHGGSQFQLRYASMLTVSARFAKNRAARIIAGQDSPNADAKCLTPGGCE
jgi:hypothetical protein